MSHICKYCLGKFNTEQQLETHQKNTKYCKNYKNVLFTCLNCNFQTHGIKNIDNHVKNCYEIIPKDDIINPSKTEKKKTIDSELENKLFLLKLENKVLRNIIHQNTNIKLSDIFYEDKNGINIHNTGDDISLIVHNYVKQNPNPKVVVKEVLCDKSKSSEKITHENISTCNIEIPVIPNDNSIMSPTTVSTEIHSTITSVTPSHTISDKKRVYRAVNEKFLDISTEPPKTDIVPDINVVDKNITENTVEQINIDDVKLNCIELINKLPQNRVYTKILEKIRRNRISIFPLLTIKQYENLLLEHISMIEKIFEEKNYTGKKSNSTILKGLTALESRITYYNEYNKKHLDIDEIQTLEKVLESNFIHEKEYVPFNINNISTNFYNYGIVLLSMRQNLSSHIFNRYGFNNIIYLPLAKNTKEDPFSFYILNKVDKTKRYWIMDCRLENTSNTIISNLLPYMISIFRKLYNRVFGDNEYRENYYSNCQITECDCQQLIQNIFILGQPHQFYNLLRTLVIEKSSYNPTENDKFNLMGDDSLQRKRFQNSEDIDHIDITRQLFDGVTSEEAVDFYRDRIV